MVSMHAGFIYNRHVVLRFDNLNCQTVDVLEMYRVVSMKHLKMFGNSFNQVKNDLKM